MDNLTYREAVRKRPGMYFGEYQDGSATIHIVLELIANVVDLFMAGRATSVKVHVEGREITVADDGPGLAFDQPSQSRSGISEAEDHLMNPHFTASARGHAPHIHCGNLRGVGLAAIVAIADRFDVGADNGSQGWRQRYEVGLPFGATERVGSTGKSGTTFSLTLPREFVAPDMARLRTRIGSQAILFPGLRIELNDEVIHAPQGLLGLALSEFRKLHADDDPGYTLWHRESYERYRLDVALVGVDRGQSLTRTWVNGVEITRGGSHLNGLDKALDRHNQRPAVKLLHVIMEEPKFAGPVQDKLVAPHMVGLVDDAMTEILRQGG